MSEPPLLCDVPFKASSLYLELPKRWFRQTGWQPMVAQWLSSLTVSFVEEGKAREKFTLCFSRVSENSLQKIICLSKVKMSPLGIV